MGQIGTGVWRKEEFGPRPCGCIIKRCVTCLLQYIWHTYTSDVRNIFLCVAKTWAVLSGFLCLDDVSENQCYNEIAVLLTPSLNSPPMRRHIERDYVYNVSLRQYNCLHYILLWLDARFLRKGLHSVVYSSTKDNLQTMRAHQWVTSHLERKQCTVRSVSYCCQSIAKPILLY